MLVAFGRHRVQGRNENIVSSGPKKARPEGRRYEEKGGLDKQAASEPNCAEGPHVSPEMHQDGRELQRQNKKGRDKPAPTTANVTTDV
jgi:hypothetical protein